MQSNRFLFDTEKIYSILFPVNFILILIRPNCWKNIPFEDHLKFLGIILENILIYEHHINKIIIIFSLDIKFGKFKMSVITLRQYIPLNIHKI